VFTIAINRQDTLETLTNAQSTSPTASSSLPPPPLPLEASKLALGPLSQLLENSPHLRQLALQPRPRIIISTLIQSQVNMTLNLTSAIGRVVVQSLRHEFNIQGSLHELWQRVSLALLKRGDERQTALLKQVGQDLVREAGGCGADFAVDEDEREEHVVDVGLRVGGSAGSGRPGFGGDAGGDGGLQGVDDGFDVGLEEAGVDLGEDVADGLAFVGEFDGE
jgi:hypothetical protein